MIRQPGHRRGQSGGDTFAIGIQRNRIDRDQGRRHHMGGQALHQKRVQPALAGQCLGRSPADIGHQPGRLTDLVVQAHIGPGYIRVAAQHGLHLARFNAKAAMFDLFIHAPLMHQPPIDAQMADIAGAVNPLHPGGPQINRRIPLGCQEWPPVIAGGKAAAEQTNLATVAQRYRAQPVIQHADAFPGQRPAHGDRLPRLAQSGGGQNGDFGRPIGIDDLSPLAPPQDQIGRTEFTHRNDMA